VRDIAPGEQLASFASFSHTMHDFEDVSYSYPHGEPLSEACSACLCWSAAAQPLRCEGCASAWCSPKCRSWSQEKGHALCCAGLSRIHSMKSRKFSPRERSTACFLLRAFAQRASEANHRHSQPALDGEPSFEQATAQCQQVARSGASASSAARIVRLAKLQAGRLVDEADALRLVGAEACNSFHLFDERERVRGSAMYPEAAMINHSCLPNCVMTAHGRHLALESISPISFGEELTYCYVRSFEAGSKETLDPWGFECDCVRCAGTHPEGGEGLEAFDAKHKCTCGKIVKATMARVAAESGRCRCHAHNTTSVGDHGASEA